MEGAALFASLVAVAALNPLLPAIMASTGRAGTEFIVLALAPLFALAAAGGVGAWTRPVMRPMVAVALILALSLTVSEHLKDGAVKLFVTVSGLAWAGVLVGERARLARVAGWGAPLTLALWAASAATRDALPRPSHTLALAVLYARLILDEEDRPRRLQPSAVLVDVGLVGVIFLSTFRAATLARSLGAQVGCSVGVLVVSMSNVPTLDWTGGTLLMAVWLYALAATEGARSIDPGARFAHGPAPRSHDDPPRTDPALPRREALS